MIPGEYFIKDGEIELNAGRKTVTLTVSNTGDRPIQVGSHYHFFETNPALKFERKKARGMRLNIPVAVSNVVYSVHMYIPHAFTHQGVHQQGPSYRYPGLIDGKQWDKGQLEKALQPVITFQKRYGVHIYIGEFSAIRWAPENSAYRYLSDLIDIFEAHGWDWSYHAFREWSGWSVEHGPERQDTQPTSSPTDRQRLLCDWFAHNQQPHW